MAARREDESALPRDAPPTLSMSVRLHREGRWRARLGAAFGGDAELGDRVWRRGLHLFGLAVLLYYVLPPRFFLVVSNEEALLLALAVVLVLESLRLLGRVELPTIRPHERSTVASYTWFAIGLVTAVLLFPKPIAVVVVLGTAIIDPLIGELRLRPERSWANPAVPVVAYAAMAVPLLWGLGGWRIAPAFAVGIGVALLAVAIERPKVPSLDDDLLMTLVPGLAVFALLVAVPGLPVWGP